MAKKEKKTKQKKDMKGFLIRMFFKRIPIIVLFALFFMFLSFKLLEQFPDPLREGIEQYFTQSTPYVASIGKLERIQFFPSLYIGISDMTLHEEGNVALTRMEMDRGKIHIPFFSKFNHSRLLYDLGIENLKADPGALFAQSIDLKSLHLVDLMGPNNETKAELIAVGQYADQDMRLKADISRKKTWLGYKVYRLDKTMPFTLTIGETELKADFVYLFDKVAVQNAVLSIKDNEILMKDTLFVEDRQLSKNNTIMCMLENDYSDLETLCLDYRKEEETIESIENATE